MVNPALRGLYVLTDERLGDRMESVVSAALTGGARLVQYRDKSRDQQRREREAHALRELTREHHALFLVNDDPVLAASVSADGVHLGRDDPDVAGARKLLGTDAVIGVSCYDSLSLARAAVVAGASYLAFGSMYPSSTKPGAVRAPLELLMTAKSEFATPLCAIGGVTPQNAGALVQAGADMIAVVSAVVFAIDPQAAARRLAAIVMGQ